MMVMKMKVTPWSLPLRNVQSSKERSHDHLSCGFPRQKGSCIWAVFGSWLSEGKRQISPLTTEGAGLGGGPGGGDSLCCGTARTWQEEVILLNLRGPCNLTCQAQG